MLRRAFLAFTCSLGCSADVELRIFGEDFVERGIPADEFADGWAIEFSEFVVAVDDVRVSPGGEVGDEGYVFDLAADSGGRGHVLGGITTHADRLHAVRYRIAAPEGAVAGNASDAQVERMREGGLAVWVDGTATRDSEAVAFSWGIPADLITSRGRGADIMMPMALPSVGGMAIELITLFVVPVLYCAVEELRLHRPTTRDDTP